jgi:pimeloyl-ACP methyl ester carboxylesterase
VVGHSLGGGVAMQFAYQYPDRCERLVLVSAGGVSRSVHPALRLATTPGSEHVMALLSVPGAKPLTRALFHVLRRLDSDLAVDTDELMSMCDRFGYRASRQAFVRTLRAVVDFQGQAVTMLDRCYLTQGMPTLLVWGRRDAVLTLEHGLTAHAAMPGSRLVVFEDAGHFPHRHDPALFCALLRELLATTPAASYSTEQWRALLRRGRVAATQG